MFNYNLFTSMKKLTLILSMLMALISFNANAEMYIVGNDPLGGWAYDGGTLMTDNGDGTFTYKATFNGTVWFVFANGQGTSWADFNGNYRIGPLEANEIVNANTEYNTQFSDNGDASYQFTGTGHEYTFTFDSNDMTFKVEGIVDVPTEDTWTVAGSSLALFGTSWDATNADNDMTLVNGLYTFTRNNVELTVGAIQFKVVKNHDWGIAYPSSNYNQAIAKHGYYDVVITFDAETHEVTCTPTLLEEIIDEEPPVYTVAGAPAALFGTEWAPALVENEMTRGQNGIYTWTKNNVALTAGNVEFKVILGHEWGVEYPSSNYVAPIEENGTYNVTITFDPATEAITFTATAVEVGEDFYTVAGAPAALFGTEWAPGNAANNMTLVDGLYTWTKEGVELTAGTIEFKVVKNANWSTSYPAGPNYTYNVAEGGTYNVTITFNPETEEITFACVAQGGPVSYDGEVYILGEVNDNGGWFPNIGVQMTKGENGIYTATITTAGENDGYSYFSFSKILAENDYENGGWDELNGYRFGASVNDFEVTEALLGEELNLSNGANAFKIPTGKWNLTLSVDEMTLVVEAVAEPIYPRGDVDQSGDVSIDDVTALIDMLLTGMGITNTADCDLSGDVSIDDVTCLIDYLLTNHW